MAHLHSPEPQSRTGFWGSRYSIGLVVLGAIAAYFLLVEHRAHLLGALPILLLLACPLMHVFMHRGHGGHGAGGQHHRQDDAKSPVKAEVRDAGGRR